MNTKKTILIISMLVSLSLPALSSDNAVDEVNQRIETKVTDIPNFKSPVCLLVGLNSSELAYREISSLSGFEMFTVPYRADINELVDQIKPSQIIIKHPSGFVGLYTTDGGLIRGVQTVNGPQIAAVPGALPPSIILPTEANTTYDAIYYPGSNTGGVSQGGLGYSPPPKGRGLKRHFLKLGTLIGLTPFQYPGYFMAYNTYSQEKLVPSLLIPNIPTVIGAASSYADAKLDQSEYAQARPQPRDYMFQPVLEGY
jgi:hypothetical protein